MLLAIVTTWTLVIGTPGVSAPEAGILLRDPIARVEIRGEQRWLIFDAVVLNNLPVATDELVVGVLYGSDVETLQGVDVGRVFTQDDIAREADLGVLVRAVRVVVHPGQAIPFVFEVPLPDLLPEPTSFRTHLLGYAVSSFDVLVLSTLLRTGAAADEMAVVRTLGLGGRAPGSQIERGHWVTQVGLLASLADELVRPLPATPTHYDVALRLYATLALGVAGGKDADSALVRFLAWPELYRLDQPFQVLRAARFTGSYLQSPLAFLIPESSETVADIVRGTLARVRGEDDGQPLPTWPGPNYLIVRIGVEERGPTPLPLPTLFGIALLVLAVGLVVGWLTANRNGRRSSH